MDLWPVFLKRNSSRGELHPDYHIPFVFEKPQKNKQRVNQALPVPIAALGRSIKRDQTGIGDTVSPLNDGYTG